MIHLKESLILSIVCLFIKKKIQPKSLPSWEYTGMCMKAYVQIYIPIHTPVHPFHKNLGFRKVRTQVCAMLTNLIKNLVQLLSLASGAYSLNEKLWRSSTSLPQVLQATEEVWTNTVSQFNWNLLMFSGAKKPKYDLNGSCAIRCETNTHK